MAAFTAFELRSHNGGAAPAALANRIDASSTTFVVATGQGASYPDGSSGPFYVDFDALPVGTVGMEHVRCIARSGDTFTLDSVADRGLMGTTATSHAAGASVTHGWSALEATETNLASHYTVGLVQAAGDIIVGSAPNQFTRVAQGVLGQSPVYNGTGTVAAGNPVPAAHTHASTDVTGLTSALLGAKGTAGTPYSTSSASTVVVDSTNLTLSFTFPASGRVLLRTTANASTGADTAGVITWFTHGTTTAVTPGAFIMPIGARFNAGSVVEFLTGTPGAATQLDLAYRSSGATALTLVFIAIEAWAA